MIFRRPPHRVVSSSREGAHFTAIMARAAPQRAAPQRAASQRAQLRLALPCLILASLVLLFGGCGNRSAAATGAATTIVTDSSTGAATDPATDNSTPAPVATTSACRDRSLPSTGATPVPPQPAAAQASGTVPRQRATVETFAAASPLQQAAWLHEDGDYSGEQRLLQTLLADPQSTPAQRQEARFQLARSYLADEQPGSALTVLEQISPQASSLPADDPRRGHSEFLRAETLARLGRNAEAVAAYEAVLQLHSEVTAVVEERSADAWLAAGDWQQAANALRRAANHAGRNWEKVRLLDRVAGILEGNGRWSQAAAVYDEILAATEPAEETRSRDRQRVRCDPRLQDMESPPGRLYVSRRNRLCHGRRRGGRHRPLAAGPGGGAGEQFRLPVADPAGEPRGAGRPLCAGAGRRLCRGLLPGRQRL